MDLRHLGLPVRDERRSQQFYTDYFGFDPATTRECQDGTVIIRNAYGFALACTRLGISSHRQRSCMPGSKPQNQLRCGC
jgi:catechol 2,3-dioxygenase-like lactoylglutathione lyase family enzyme